MSDLSRRADEIFNDAVEVPTEKRAAFLEAACGGDPELRHEVDSLLSFYDDDPGFLQDASPVLPSELARNMPESTQPSPLEESSTNRGDGSSAGDGLG